MENKNNLQKGILTGMVSAIAFGTYGTFVNLLGEYGMTGDSLTVILSFVLTIYFGIVVYMKNKEAFKVEKNMLLFLAVLGFVGFDGQNYCIIQSYSKLPFGIVAAILFTVSFLVMIGSRIVFGNKITTTKISAGIVCTIGVFLVLDLFTVIQTGGFSFDPGSLSWVAGALITVGGSYVAMKYAMEKGIDGLVVFFYQNLFATLGWWVLMFSPVQMMGEITTAISAGGTLCLLGYVLITCMISFHLWATAIEMIDPSWVAIAYALDPAVEILLGFIIFSQTMNLIQCLGFVIIIAAVCYVSYLEGKEGPPTNTAANTTAN
jgi:drug/metabolite transporter (DMT)-like permease